MLSTVVVEPIIDAVINNTFTLDALYEGPVITTKISDEPFEDAKRELQSVLTEFVVNEFFPLPQDTEQFIKFVYGSFDLSLQLYRKRMIIDESSLFFVYKGGNILRYVAYEIMHEVGGQVADSIEKYYKDAFKKSDADFSIYINPKLPNYDLIFNDMNLLAYLLQDEIRKEFSGNLHKYFSFYRLAMNEKQAIIQKYLDKLNATETITNKLFGYTQPFDALVLDNIATKNIPYIQEPDAIIDFKQRDTRSHEQRNLKISKNAKIMRITSNQTLEFFKLNNKVKFSLVRTKVIFNAYSGTTLMMFGGELIDVSIPHKNDYSIAHFFEHLQNNISNYHIKSNDLIFKAPSLTYLIEDIEKILFDTQEFPWLDNKYAKRMRRLLFMYFCMLLINVNLKYNYKIKYLMYIKDNIFKKLIAPKPNFDEVIRNINIFLNNSNPNATAEVYPFRVLLKNLLTLFKAQNDEQFKSYCQLIHDNLETLIGLFDLMLKHCSQSGVSASNIVEGNELWGGNDEDEFRRKYLKYKSKYLHSKYK